MGSKAWRDWNPPDDGEEPEADERAWVDLKPDDPGYDHAYARDMTPIADRPARAREDVPACGIYFGAQVGWDTTREGGRVLLQLGVTRDGERATVEVCKVCGDNLADVRLDGRTVCAGCLKSGTGSVEVKLEARPYETIDETRAAS